MHLLSWNAVYEGYWEKITIDMKFNLILIFCFLVIRCSFGGVDENVNASSSECPSHWEKIGTGCYLFAIPEILRLDDSCRVDGKSKTCLATKSRKS